MSWNPRRFADLVTSRYVAGGEPPTLLWLTAEAVERITSAVDNGIIEHVETPVIHGGVVVGLAAPLATPVGEASILISGAGNGEGVQEGWLKQAATLPAPLAEKLTALALRLDTEDNGTGGLGLINRRGVQIGVTSFDVGTWNVLPPIENNELDELASELGMTAGEILEPEDAQGFIDLLHSAWTLLHTPVEADVTATVVYRDLVEVGKKRKPREQAVSVIDVRRPPSVVRYAPSGRVVEHDHRWTVRGHWRNQAWGKGRALRRRVWIDAHVAGPEDKPLINRPKVQVIR